MMKSLLFINLRIPNSHLPKLGLKYKIGCMLFSYKVSENVKEKINRNGDFLN